MDKTELSKYLGIIIIAMITSTGVNQLFDSGEPVTLYSCESTGIVSDCVNGIKACNDQGICKRCYWDETNTRRYKHCAEGWKDHFITFGPDPDPEKPDKFPATKMREGSYPCYREPRGCEP